jgi:hemerythrin-like domain-containing protein
MCDHCGCRSYPPIAELTAEHEEILRLAWELVEAARLGMAPEASTRRDLLALLDLHATKEETGLFPALVATGGLSPDNVADLEAEHRELHRQLAAARLDRRDFYALAAHIEEEEMELFPAAMLGFDQEEWSSTRDAHRAAEDRPAPSVR